MVIMITNAVAHAHMMYLVLYDVECVTVPT